MDAGMTGAAPLERSQSGGCRVRASTITTPSDHTSDAGEIFPSATSGASWGDRAGFTGGVKRVGGKFQLPIGNHNVGGLEMTMQEVEGVEPGKRVHNRAEHIPGFAGGEGTLAKNLGENLFGVFRDDVEQIDAVDVTAPGMRKTDQVGMKQRRGRCPLSDAGFRIHCIRRSQLDGGLLRRIRIEFGEEDAALLSSA